MGVSVVSGRDAAPILQSAEHVLDAVALALQHAIVGQRLLARPGGRDAGRDAASFQRAPAPGAVVAATADQFPRGRQDRQQQSGAVMVTALALGHQQGDGPPLPVARGVQLGVQAALGAADMSRTPFCSRLAAVRCALRWVASIISRAGAPPLAARAAKMRAKTPSRLQRMNRL